MRASLLLILLLIPVVSADLQECLRQEQPGKIPCLLVTSWSPPRNCSTYNVSYYNENGSFLDAREMGQIGMSGRCNATFNYTTTGQYYANSSIDTWNIQVEGEDNMIGFGVIVFFMSINLALFLLPSYVQMGKSEAYQNMNKKILWMLGLLMLFWNSSLLLSMSNNAGLGIGAQIIFWIRLISILIFPAFVLLLFNTVLSTSKMLKLERHKKRMGEDD